MPVSAKALAARISDASVSSSRRGFSAAGLGEMLTTTFGEGGGGGVEKGNVGHDF